MIRPLLGVAALVAAWLWSRGARDPREWPTRLPAELATLRHDLEEAASAGRRAIPRGEQDFEEAIGRAHAER